MDRVPRHVPLIACAFAAAWLAAPACGHTRLDTVGGPDGGPGDAGDGGDGGGPDAGPDAGGEPDAGTDAGSDAGPDAGPWITTRAILHLHSPISHDACDGHSKHTGDLAGRDQECLQQLFDALCADKIDVAFVTDHPAYLREQTFEDALLYRAGHGQTLLDRAGNPVASADAGAVTDRVDCGGGRSVLIATGWEGTHTLPLGLERKLDDPLYGVATTGADPLADQQALLAGLHDAGAVYFTAHSEEPDLPASRLVELRTDGMEWYNPHGNFKHVFGQDGSSVGGGVDPAALADGLKALRHLEPFLAGSSAQADLVLLDLLAAGFPEAGYDKVHAVIGQRRIATGLGSDVHQNVSVKPLCKGAVAMALCQAVASASPNLLTELAAGGTLVMSDGGRIDSFARIMRWLNNRVLVHEVSMPAVRDALGAGRSYGLFAVFGEPGDFAVWAETSAGRLELGGEGPAAGAVLRARLPDAPAPELGAQWTAQEAALAGLHAVLFRTTAAGKEIAAEWTAFGATVELPITAPGAYTLEVRIVPRHLAGQLGAARALADVEYRWILPNPIFLR